MEVKRIALGCDHGAYELKEALLPYLQGQGYEVEDFGCFSTESMDYPDVAFPVAEAVSKGVFDRGILLCTTGIGMSVCANKVKGIRCSLCTDANTASMTRQHNDTNVLAIGAVCVSLEQAKEIANIWLTTAFSQGERHLRRIAKIAAYEHNN